MNYSYYCDCLPGDLPCEIVCPPVVSNQQSYRAFVATLNNPSTNDVPRRWEEHCEFITWQLEKGEKGTPHLQIYFVLKSNPRNKNGRSFAWVKKNIDPHMWFSNRKGTHEEALAYANKEDTRLAGPWTIGEWSETMGPSRGGQKGGAVNSSKILAIKRKIDEGVPEEELWNSHFGEFLRYSNGFSKYKMIKKGNHRNWYTKCLVFYGPPGTGKSQRARDYAKGKYGNDVYYLNINHKKDTVYWDGYSGEKCVVIEEYISGIPITYFNKLHDKFPMNLEFKGGAYPFLAELIIYTSNKDPQTWYGNEHDKFGAPTVIIPEEVLNAFKRRLTGVNGCCIEMKDVYVDPNPDIGMKEWFYDDEKKVQAQLLEASEHVHQLVQPIDLTEDDDDWQKDWDDEVAAGYIDSQEDGWRDEVGDDDAGVDDEAYLGDTQSLNHDEDDDVNDKTPPLSQKRMFPPPLNLRTASRLTLQRDSPLPGRFKKPRQAGTGVQTTIELQK